MSDDIVTRMRQLAGAMSEARFPALEATAIEAADEIERLRAERDEARQEICRNEADLISLELGGAAIFAASVAKRRGWDCFKETMK